MNATSENVKWILQCCMSVDAGPFGMINSVKGMPPDETLMISLSAFMAIRKLNGRVKVAVALLLLVTGLYAVPFVNCKLNSLNLIDLIMSSFPWFGSTVSMTRLLIPLFNHVT